MSLAGTSAAIGFAALSEVFVVWNQHIASKNTSSDLSEAVLSSEFDIVTISPQESRIDGGKRQEKCENNSEIVQRLGMLGHSDVTGCGGGVCAAALRHGAAPKKETSMWNISRTAARIDLGPPPIDSASQNLSDKKF